VEDGEPWLEKGYKERFNKGSCDLALIHSVPTRFQNLIRRTGLPR